MLGQRRADRRRGVGFASRDLERDNCFDFLGHDIVPSCIVHTMCPQDGGLSLVQNKRALLGFFDL